MTDSPFPLPCLTRFILQEKLTRGDVHIRTWPVCKMKRSTKEL